MEGENLKTDDILHPVLEKLEKRYEYITRLGGGEFSNVFLMREYATGKEVALKILDYHFLIQRLRKESQDESTNKFNEIKKRFMSEAKLYQKIDHPNIVKIREMGVFEDEKEEIEIPYFIMDYVKGTSLDKVIKSKAPIDLDKVVRISDDILSALEVIHRNNIIHRDLKPGNIMIEEETGGAILIDFGIAKDIMGGTKLTTTGAILGTPAYMAPEQFKDSSAVVSGTDIYSFGIVLYEMLTGEVPFKGNFLEIMNGHMRKPIPSVTQKNPALPEGLNYILSKALAKDVNGRYRIATDFLNAINRADKQKPPQRFIKYLILLGIAALIAVVIFLMIPKEKIISPPPDGQIEIDYINAKAKLEGGASLNEKLDECSEFLKKYDPKPEKIEVCTMRFDIECMAAILEEEIKIEKQYRVYIDSAKRFMGVNDFEPAADALLKAKKLKDTDEVKRLLKELQDRKAEFEKQNGTKLEYDAVTKNLNLDRYLEFKTKYPKSVYIHDLKTRLVKADSILPPEKYWDKPIKKNSKGYYEYTFDMEHNGHVMVYIPVKRFWIDKYEVSNLQFRRYAAAEKIIMFSQKQNKYINEGDGYPVVVSYSDAERYCKKYGFSLPTSVEWEYAAGKGINIYPWGEELPASDGMWRANIDNMDGTEDKDGFIGTAPVKSFERFASPFGLVNMAGNVSEWVRERLLKGGGFLSTVEDLMITKSKGGRENDKEGFRCVKEESESQN
jgi:serine/threonine protein kinase